MAYDESIVFRREGAEWQVGSHCQAVWSVDGLVYPATVVWVEGERCRVKFDNYGNEEEMDLSALLPEAANQPKREILSCKDETDSDEILGDNPLKPRESILPKCVPCKGLIDPKVWMLGSRCRAVYSEDGLVYPAVLVWMRGERCRVKFDGYGNEEELDLSTLLSPVDAGGHSDVKRLGSSSKNCADYKKTDEEWRSPQLGQREELFSPQPTRFPPGKDCGKSSYSLDRNQLDKPGGPNGPTTCGRGDPNVHFSLCPPVPPPKGFLDFLPPVPPPPPPSTCVRPPQPGQVEPSNVLDSVMTDLSSMLLSWYLCGYHTGCYTAVQQMNANRSSDGKKKQAKE